MGVKNEITPQDIIEYLNELCPIAMSLGMTLTEYWQGEPSDINFYIKADEIRRKKLNHKMWLQGAYFYHAICSASPLFNSLKPQRPKPYLKEPFPMSAEEDEERKYQKFKQQMFDLTTIKKNGKEG